MPTARPRLTVTETPAVARRLDLAASRFPELAASRQSLLLRLTEIAEEALLAGDPDRTAARRRLLARTAAIGEVEADAMLDARDADWDRGDR